MSFILDALRRADRERESERGGVPSLHTQAAPLPGPQSAGPDAAPPRPWLWLAAGLGGGLVLAAVWALWSATPTTTAVIAPAELPPPAPQVTPPVAPPVAVAPPATPTPIPTPAPPPAEPRRQTAQANTKPEPPPRSEPKPARPAPVAERPAPKEATPAPAPSPAPAPTPAPPSERAAPPLRQYGELSAEQRSALPKLTIGGAMYSANASSRRLIVNGQLLSEGDAVAPGVTLEEIRLKSAVLRSKELRYELGF